MPAQKAYKIWKRTAFREFAVLNFLYVYYRIHYSKLMPFYLAELLARQACPFIPDYTPIAIPGRDGAFTYPNGDSANLCFDGGHTLIWHQQTSTYVALLPAYAILAIQYFLCYSHISFQFFTYNLIIVSYF